MQNDLLKHTSRFLRRIFLLWFVLWGLSCGHAWAAISMFEMDEKRSNNITPFPKWTGMYTRYDEQQTYAADASCGTKRFFPCAIGQWHDLIVAIKNLPFREQLNQVNSWGNSHPYIEDQINWGLEDYWETPNEFMEISGDCEDYAITKYYTLRALGYSADRLRIIILQDQNLGGVIHAVLGVYDDEGVMYILDNQSQRVTPALKIYHYRPIFGINEDAWWAYYPRY